MVLYYLYVWYSPSVPSHGYGTSLGPEMKLHLQPTFTEGPTEVSVAVSDKTGISPDSYRLLWERSPRPLEGHTTIAWYNLPEGSELVLDPVDFQEQGMVWWMGRQRELYMPMPEQVPNESSVTEAGGSEGRKESDIDTWTSDNTETSFQSFQWLMCCNV